MNEKIQLKWLDIAKNQVRNKVQRQSSDCEKSEMVVGRCESVTAWSKEDKRARLLDV